MRVNWMSKRWLAMTLILAVTAMTVFAPAGGQAVNAAGEEEDTSLYSFEEGSLNQFAVEAWDTITIDESRSYRGDASAQITFHEGEKHGFWQWPADIANHIEAGDTIAFWVYAPAGGTIAFQAYIQDSSWGNWTDVWVDDDNLERDEWVKVELPVPSTYSTPIALFGINFYPDNDYEFDTLWIDSIDVVKGNPGEEEPGSGNEGSSVIYDFEDGELGGFSIDSNGAVSVSGDKAYKGLSSLQIDLNGENITLNSYSGLSEVKAGDTITLRVWVPQELDMNIMPYLNNSENKWQMAIWVNSGGYVKDDWYTIKFQVPGSYTTPLTEFGIQFLGVSGPGTIWLDSVEIGDVDVTELSFIISEAEALYRTAEEGTEVGQYAVGSKETLNAAIQAAMEVKNSSSITFAQVSEAIVSLNDAIALFQAGKVTAGENVTIYYNDVINDIQHDFWGVNYVAFWDEAQGSEGSKQALKKSGIDFLRFPGGVPGNYYDWSYDYHNDPNAWSTTTPADLWEYAQDVNAGIMWQTNPTANPVNDDTSPIPAFNDPSGEHVQAMMDYFAEEGIEVQYYEIGNELDLELMDPSGPPRQEAYMEYIDAYHEQAAAIKENDPNAFVMGPAATNAWYWWGLDSLGMFMEEVGDKQGTGNIDGVSLHWYPAYERGWEYAKRIASGWQENMDFIQQTIQNYDTRELPLFITETSATYTFNNDATGESKRVSGALATADMMGAYRNSGVQSVTLFGAIHYADNNWGIFYGPGESKPLDTPTPIYFTLPIWTKAGDQVLAAAGMNDVIDGTAVYASKKDDGSAQVVIINKDAAATDVNISFDGLDITGADVKIYEMKPSNGSHHDVDVVYNGELMPDPATEELPAPLSDVSNGSVYTREVPGYSMTLLDFQGGAQTASSDTRMDSLYVNDVQAQPSSENKLSYNVNVPNSPATATVIAVPADAGASYEAIAPDELAVGPNQATVVVTAEDGTEQTYTVTINRAGALQDLWILKDYKDGQWSGGAVENVNGELPFDEDQVYNGLPSYRLNVQGDDGWWTSLLAKNSWSTYNILPYYESGYLEFNIKGAEGGETFQVGVRSRQYGHDPEEVTQSVSLADYATVTTEWQKVRIPVKDIIDPASGFDMKQTWLLVFDPVNSSKFKVWLNGIKLTSTDEETEFPAVKVNQLGYLTNAEKYALVTGFPSRLAYKEGDSFRLKNASDDEVVMTGELTLVSEYEPVVSGEKILKADFGEWKEAGEYVIEVGDGETVQTSPAFKIGDDLYNELLRDSARYFYYQRAGMALEEEYAGQWARPLGHPQDSAVRLESQLDDPDAERRDFSGGWYDAGDYGKYTNAGATAVSDLLWAYEMFPSKFPDNQLGIPESGNDIPDLLDEVRYELDFLMKMQDQASGGFYHRIFPQGGCVDASVCLPHESSEERYVSDIAEGLTNVRPTGHTASAVGVLAHASIVYDKFDEAYSAKLLQTAEAGWQYLLDNPEPIVSPGGPYYTNDDKLDRFYAAAALFRATGEQTYHDYVLAHYADFAEIFSPAENAHGVGNLAPIAYLHYMMMPNREAEVEAWYREHYEQWKVVQLARSDRQAWKNTLDDGTDNLKDGESDYYWGSNMPMLNTSLTLAVGSQLLGTYTEDVRTVALRNLNYLLGVNPLRFSYVSGYGEDSVQHIYSNIYSSDGIDAIPPGYMAGGPNIFQGAHFSLFAGKAYNDVDTEWTTNEHTIYWNSTLVFSSAFASADPELQPVPGNNNKLRELTLDGSAVEGFDKDQLSYRIVVPNSKTSIVVEAVADGYGATVEIVGGSQLSVGKNDVRIVVTAEDGSELTYTIEVVRQAAAGIVAPPRSSSSASIPAGHSGSVSLGNKASVWVPASASDQNLQLSIEELLSTAGLIDESDKLISPIFELLKNKAGSFLIPVKLTFAFDVEAIGDEEKPSIFYYDEERKVWVEIGGTADGNQITAEVDHFTKFAVFAVAQEGAEEPQRTVSDIAGHWAEARIEKALQEGIVSGFPDGTFRPEEQVTRAQFTVMLMNALGADDEDAAPVFSDSARIGSWAKRAVAQAVDTGIVSGYKDGSFRPNEAITRAEMAVMIARAFNLAVDSEAGTSFADDAEIPAWAKGAAEAAKERGIVQGRGENRFAPKEASTRAEAITVILNGLQ